MLKLKDHQIMEIATLFVDTPMRTLAKKYRVSVTSIQNAINIGLEMLKEQKKENRSRLTDEIQNEIHGDLDDVYNFRTLSDPEREIFLKGPKHKFNNW